MVCQFWNGDGTAGTRPMRLPTSNADQIDRFLKLILTRA